jgi:hypothetical protein
MTLKEKVETYLGSVHTDTLKLLDLAAREIVNTLPIGLLQVYGPTNADDGNVVNVTDKRVISVTRSNVPCRLIPVTMYHQALDATSREYASILDPVYYNRNEVMAVIPSGGVVQYFSVPYPALTISTEVVAEVAPRARDLVPLKAAILGLQSTIGKTVVEMGSVDLTITFPTAEIAALIVPTFPSTTDFTDAGTALTAEDIELSTGYLQRYQAALLKYKEDNDAYTVKLNAILSRYRSELEGQIAKVQARAQSLQGMAGLTPILQSLTAQYQALWAEVTK